MPPPSHPHSVLVRLDLSQSILFQLSSHPSGCFSTAQYIVSDEHPPNAYLPIEVTPSGITTLVSDVQSLNAYSPIEVTPLGITTLVSDEQL